MSDKEMRKFKEILEKQYREVSTSKAAARKLLTSLGLLTASGKPKKSFRPQTNVSR
jgi:hypothetical protein